MKYKTFSRTLIGRLRLALLLSVISLPALACTINLVYSDVSTPPYYFGDGEVIPPNPGIGVEIANEAATKVGCKINWKRVPNRRVQLEMEGGRADAMLLFSFNEERAGYSAYPMKDGKHDPSLRLANLSYYIYVLQGSPLKWDGKQFNLGNQIFGINAGYSARQDLLKMGLVVEEATGTENNLKKLQQGRISAYVMQDGPADLAIDELNLNNVVKLPIPFSSKDYYIPFSKKFYQESPGIADKFWKQMAELRKTRLKELLKKYRDVQ